VRLSSTSVPGDAAALDHRLSLLRGSRLGPVEPAHPVTPVPTKPSIAVDVNSVLRQNAVSELGGQSEGVTVTANAVQVHTFSTFLNNLLERSHERLPSNQPCCWSHQASASLRIGKAQDLGRAPSDRYGNDRRCQGVAVLQAGCGGFASHAGQSHGMVKG
jgi:hypothetical protein